VGYVGDVTRHVGHEGNEDGGKAKNFRNTRQMGTQSPKGPSSSRKSALTKKAYVAPVLVTWGTLRDMTQHVGNSGKADGGKKRGMTKTR